MKRPRHPNSYWWLVSRWMDPWLVLRWRLVRTVLRCRVIIATDVLTQAVVPSPPNPTLVAWRRSEAPRGGLRRFAADGRAARAPARARRHACSVACSRQREYDHPAGVLRKGQEALLRRETFGDDHVGVNVEIWSGCEEVLRASACLSSEGQGTRAPGIEVLTGITPENGNRAGGVDAEPINEVRTRVAHETMPVRVHRSVRGRRIALAGVTASQRFALDHRTYIWITAYLK